MSIAAARLPRLGTPLLGAALNGPGTPSRAETPALLPSRASVEPSFVGDQPSFLRSTPYARSSLAESSSSSSGGAGLSFPSGPDGQTVHSAPTMAHSATLPALISAYSALNRAIIVDPQSALAGGQPPVGGKNAKRLRAAYHLSFQSAPPEAYSPSPSLFASIAVPSARTTGLVPQVPPISSGVVLPPEVARARSRAVVAGLPTTALAPGGAHRHPNMLANVLHYIAPPGLLLRASRMAEPGPLIEKGKELYYGPVYDSKGVIVTTTGGGIIRHRLPPVKPVGGTHPKGPKGKGKGKGHKKKGGRDSDDEFEALLLDGPPPEDDDDDDGFLVVGNGYGAGDLGDGEWEEEEEELVVEVKEVDVELRATVGSPLRHSHSPILTDGPALARSGTRPSGASRTTSCRLSANVGGWRERRVRLVRMKCSPFSPCLRRQEDRLVVAGGCALPGGSAGDRPLRRRRLRPPPPPLPPSAVNHHNLPQRLRWPPPTSLTEWPAFRSTRLPPHLSPPPPARPAQVRPPVSRPWPSFPCSPDHHASLPCKSLNTSRGRERKRAASCSCLEQLRGAR